MRVKVGLVTSSSEAASKACAIPLTKVVLPAPRSPRRTTSFAGRSKGASSRPRAIVSSGEDVVNSRALLETATPKYSRRGRPRLGEGCLWSRGYPPPHGSLEFRRPVIRKSQEAAVIGRLDQFVQDSVMVVVERDEPKWLVNDIGPATHGFKHLGHPLYIA